MKGVVQETEQSKRSRGGTEQMRDRLLHGVKKKFLRDVAIHFSRPRELAKDVPNVLYCHDLALDPEMKILANGGWSKFDHIVFVSRWQRDQYMWIYGIPYSHCTVIPNAIEIGRVAEKSFNSPLRLIYHTTPHRGLQILLPAVSMLANELDFPIHLDVYSSFSVYGWETRDQQFEGLFQTINDNPNMTYHGGVSNREVLKSLDKAHIFAYPCIWQETSCIALIEAIQKGLVCIHPDYGALCETAGMNSHTYAYHENIEVHFRRFKNKLKTTLELMNGYPEIFEKDIRDRQTNPDHEIEMFINAWDDLLIDIRSRP